MSALPEATSPVGGASAAAGAAASGCCPRLRPGCPEGHDAAAPATHHHQRHWTHTFDDGSKEDRLHSSEDAAPSNDDATAHPQEAEAPPTAAVGGEDAAPKATASQNKKEHENGARQQPPAPAADEDEVEIIDDDDDDEAGDLTNAPLEKENEPAEEEAAQQKDGADGEDEANATYEGVDHEEEQYDEGEGEDDEGEDDEGEEVAEGEEEAAEAAPGSASNFDAGDDRANAIDLEEEEAGEDEEGEDDEDEAGEAGDAAADDDDAAMEEDAAVGDEFGEGEYEEDEEAFEEGEEELADEEEAPEEPVVVSKDDAVDLTLDESDEEEQKQPAKSASIMMYDDEEKAPEATTTTSAFFNFSSALSAATPPVASPAAAAAAALPSSSPTPFALSSASPLNTTVLPPPSTRPMFSSPFQTSPYPAHSSRNDVPSASASTSATAAARFENHSEPMKAAFMSPTHKSKRPPHKSPHMAMPASLSLTAQPAAEGNHSVAVPAAAAAAAPASSASASASSLPRASLTSSHLEPRRAHIKEWAQAKVCVERRMKRHPHPYRALMSTFPYARQSLVPTLQAHEAQRQQPAQFPSLASRLPLSLATAPNLPAGSGSSTAGGPSSRSFYLQSTRRTATSGAPPRDFYALEWQRIQARRAQLDRQVKMIQAYQRSRQRIVEDELDLSLESLSMTDVDVTRANVHTQSLAVQNRFISSDIDLRIKIEKFAPAWLLERLFQELLVEAREELVKETVADGKRVCVLPESEMARSTQLMQSPLKAIIADKFNIELVGGDLVKLRNLDWLSDQTINFYMEMLAERQKRNQASTAVLASQKARIHYFNTFFYNKLSPDGAREYKYKDVARWLKRAKIDITTLDKVILPVHVSGNHWCLAIINLAEKRFEYFDSLGGRNPHCLQNLRQYVRDEVQANAPAKLEALQLDTWTEKTWTDIPRQNNGSDCGVFTIKFADYASENRPFEFTHRDMPYFRRRIALEILYQRVI